MRKTVEWNNDDETKSQVSVATLTAGQARALPVQNDPKEFSFNLAVESLRAAGASEPEVSANALPDGIFDKDSPYKLVVRAAMEVNGFKEAPAGEVRAGESPAPESIGLSIMDASPVPTDGGGAT